MKKLFAAILSLCLMLSAVAVFAEAAAPKEINWSDYTEQASKVNGELVHINSTDLQIFVPAEFKDNEISAEAAQKGNFLLLTAEDGKAAVNGQIAPMSLDTFMAGVGQQAQNVTQLKINGILCTNFNLVNNGVLSTCIAINTDQNSTLLFSFTPANQDPYTNLIRIMVASLQHEQK